MGIAVAGRGLKMENPTSNGDEVIRALYDVGRKKEWAMAINDVEAALDRLADMGMSALMRDVVEPVCVAMIARSAQRLARKQGAKDFFAEYWSLARAIGLAFEDPTIATRCVAIFFSAAPGACADWAHTELVEGRPRLGLRDLKELVEAASSARDKNQGAYGAELVESMVGRQSDGAGVSMRAASALDPPRAPGVVEELSRDLGNSFIWPKDAVLEDMLARLAAEAVDRGSLGADMWAAALGQIEEVSMGRRNQGLSCAFAMRLGSLAARSPRAMGVDAEQWAVWMDHVVDACESAAQQASEHRSGLSKGLSALDAQMLASWGMVLGSARERFASELALGALERAMEPGGSQASVQILGLFKDMFWGRGALLGKGAEEFQKMARALCSRMCRDGAAACLPLAGAKMLYGMASGIHPAPPTQWSAAIDPETMSWLVESSGAAVDGSQWRQLAACARVGAIEAERKKEWERALSPASWPLATGEESMRDAISAKDMARALGPSDPLGRAVVGALDKAGVPDGDALGRLQDLLGSLSDLGASDEACSMAGDSMAQALAVLERSELARAMGSMQTSEAPSLRSRL